MAAGSSGGGSLQSPAAAAVPHPETGARAGRFEKMRGWGTGCSTGAAARDCGSGKPRTAGFQSARGIMEGQGGVGQGGMGDIFFLISQTTKTGSGQTLRGTPSMPATARV